MSAASAQSSAAPRRALPGSPFLVALAGDRPSRRPVWFMRQAGRSLPEYRALRAGRDMLATCLDPELVCEITLQPVRRHGVDAAILFSDIVVPLKTAGVGVTIKPGVGPVLDAPVRARADVDALPPPSPEGLEPVASAVGSLIAELGQTPLIGFAGAPFTLASYLVEGGPSKHHEKTKALMTGAPDVFAALLDKLADHTISFLTAQLAAGADAVQVFDSWVGALTLADYERHVLPHTRRVFAEIAQFGVPGVHFGVNTGHLLGAMAGTGAQAIGADWRTPLPEAAKAVGPGLALQGNLDPALLLAPRAALEAETRRVLADADAALAEGTPGHVFNLGHGVLPETDPGALTAVVDLVHSEPVAP
ncbi:uroporphyrinogen decarboxylase [Segniliparus rugosus]|uniref:Uroporphyrinogen decarboxylase n=1 Tax=Segniliparus rugosus (strain ATCC BAA-974 / DSM 45345 / CCUG 50838 / CIP 108380 / JCM 13579 / CDC 945) TaxID=679197 RepID=E5XSM4_SEGRC|nr:uroporphyrinogen decarboxylase [Segniliparus rugosus]EFV12701.2 uroporphyrinogen decarboxylase [Segniliparus rugosus ATCC BAA-974]